MKRVLFIDHVDRILGGAEINLVELLEANQSAARWVPACACTPGSRLQQVLKTAGVACLEHRLPERLKQFRLVHQRAHPLAAVRQFLALPRAAERLARVARTFAPQVLVSCTNKDHLVAGWMARHLPCPAVWWINDLLTPDFFPWSARMLFAARARGQASVLVAVSRAVREALVGLSLPEAKIALIQNGIPLERYQHRPRGTLRQPLGLSEQEPLFGIVGRFAPWKGQDFFVQLAHRWVGGHPEGHFVLIGQAFNEDQSYELALREYVRVHNLGDRVHFFPFRQDITAALSDLDVLIHASLRPEPFGRVLIEAMAAGVAVVAARGGGTLEILEPGSTGYLAAAGNLREYLDHLDKLTRCPALRQRIADAARACVEAHFTIERVHRQFSEILENPWPPGSKPRV